MRAKISDFALIENHTFPSSLDGEGHVYYRHYLPLNKKKKPKIHIIFQHGLIEHQMRHESFFIAMFEAMPGEVMISAMDLIGHGHSGGHRAYIESFKNFEDDWLHFLGLCAQRTSEFEKIQHFVVSHSLGGLIVLSTLSDEANQIPLPLTSLIFVNPSIAPKLKLPQLIEAKMKTIDGFINKVRVPLIYNAYDLTHDNEKAIEFIKDPLISKAITVKMAVEILKATENITRHSYFFKYDSFFILSGDDRVVDNEKTRLFITGMDKSKVVSKEYPNMCHDILNETCRNDVFREIINHIKSKESA
ncbi:MAG: hypothetical protein CME62_10520 [Halobacteriovoraceae bacterium]|nr:hypothetical protein [Halobacteriovoraceae bacterium]|tara:strand:- start:9528 stop:10436 length:909 start_codon:yes stop_codon:yes gene_type:complete